MELSNEEKAKIFAMYLGCKCQCIGEVSDRVEICKLIGIHIGFKGEYDVCIFPDFHHGISLVKLLLKPLEDIQEEHIFGLLNAMFPKEMEDRPDFDEYSFEMFYNDGALMVDGDVAAGANYSCRCYEGQIAITYDGTIHMFDENGEREKMNDVPKAYQYLLSNGFDLFGLIELGLAIDEKTLVNEVITTQTTV